MTEESGNGSPISFVRRGKTIHVRDDLEGQDLRVTATGDAPLEPALTDLFLTPVDSAVSVTTSELRIHTPDGAYLRDEHGEHIGSFSAAVQEVPWGTYHVQIVGTVNAYLRIADASFTAVYKDRQTQQSTLRLVFDEPARISIGARSHHTLPQATITVPDDPREMMTAVSYLGSSIKEFSCERSWPSLRDHPPMIERGDVLEVPSSLSKPETGVTITVPPTYADVYRIAPLAFYLGADVEEGDHVELHLENGHVEPLERRTRSGSIERAVDELLATCLLLDTLTRVGGYYTYSRYEYDDLSPHLPFYPPSLYDTSLSEQLMEYLEVSPVLLESSLPRWPLTATLRPEPADVEALPYLVNTLSRIHVSSEPREATVDAGPEQSSATRSLPGRTHEPEPWEPFTTGYTADTPPVGATRIVPEAYRNALTQPLPDPAESRTTYVTNDGERARALASVKDELEQSPPHYVEAGGITVVDRPTRAELEATLAEPTDVLFCDLPATEASLECADGPLRLDALSALGVRTFVLSEPAGIETGVALARNGARTGVVTERPLPVTQVRHLSTSLLNGRSFLEAVQLAELDEVTPHRFVGNPLVPVVRHTGGVVPTLLDIESVTLDEHELAVQMPPTDINRLGGVGKIIDRNVRDAYQLFGTTVHQPFRCATSDVIRYLEDDHYVVRLNGRIYHGDEPATGTFVRESARGRLEASQ